MEHIDDCKYCNVFFLVSINNNNHNKRAPADSLSIPVM